MADIVIVELGGERREISLDERRRYVLGRSNANDIAIPDAALSRRHAELYFTHGHWVIEDCDSANGTFVDGRRLKAPERLRAGAHFNLGNCTLEIKRTEDGGDVRYSDEPITMERTTTISAVEHGLDAGLKETPTGDSSEKEIEAFKRRLRVVEKANLELLAHEPMNVLLPKILDLVFEAVRPERAALLRREDGRLVCRAMRGKWIGQTVSISRTIAGMVLDQRVSVLTADAQSDARFAAAESIPDQGMRSAMAVPLWNNKEVIGLIYADSFFAMEAFTDEDLKVLTMLANVAAIQIENAMLFDEQVEKRRLTNEAMAAAEIQERLLPTSPPEIEGYDFIGYNLPCHEVGGDYYDCLETGDGRRAIVIGDVAGKGMGAALLMAVLQATFRSYMENAPEPRKLLGYLNSAILRSAPPNRFVTLFYAELDPASHRLRCVNAGHAPRPLVIRASGETEEVASCGPPLGIFETLEYKVVEIELKKGDFLFTCSDGVTDLVDPNEETFGDKRLKDFLVSCAGRPIVEVRSGLDDHLRGFSQGNPQPDDLTVVLFQRKG